MRRGCCMEWERVDAGSCLKELGGLRAPQDMNREVPRGSKRRFLPNYKQRPS